MNHNSNISHKRIISYHFIDPFVVHELASMVLINVIITTDIDLRA